MKFPPRLAVVFACCCVPLIAGVGCKKQSAAPAVATTAPTTSPASTSQPSTGPITVEFDGQPMTFPPAELRVRPSGTGLIATLVTLDAPDPAGANTLHLDMTFPDLANSSELDGAEWHYREPDPAVAADAVEDAAETPQVIELRHGAIALDPAEASAVIHLDDEGRATVELTGTFKWFDPPEAAKPAKTPWVTAKVQAVVRVTSRGGE